MKTKIEVVKTLLDALPYIKRFHNEKIVIKYGGSAQTSGELKEKFAQDIALVGHCGNEANYRTWWREKAITQMLSDLGGKD